MFHITLQNILRVKKMFEDEPEVYKKCEVCGGYGYNFNTERGITQVCPSCKGGKKSRRPVK